MGMLMRGLDEKRKMELLNKIMNDQHIENGDDDKREDHPQGHYSPGVLHLLRNAGNLQQASVWDKYKTGGRKDREHTFVLWDEGFEVPNVDRRQASHDIEDEDRQETHHQAHLGSTGPFHPKKIDDDKDNAQKEGHHVYVNTKNVRP